MKKLAALLMATMAIQLSYAKIQDVDRVVAIVNDNVITLSELDARVKEIETQPAAKNMSKMQLRQRILRQLIEEEVLIQYAKGLGIQISDTDIDQFVAANAAQQKLSVEAFYKKASSEGFSREKIRDEIKNGLMVERIKQSEISSRVTVTESEVNQELGSSRTTLQNQQIKLSAILITVPQNASEQDVQAKSQRAQEAWNALSKGESFASVAKKYSDLSNKSSGGDMGYKPASSLPADLNNVLNGMSEGQFTPAIFTPEGFYIFQLVDRKGTNQTEHGLSKSYKTEHILIKVNDLTSDEQALNKIKTIKAQLDNKGNFNALAKQYSEDGSAIQGGALGWVQAGEMVPEFEQAMVSLPVGQISQPVRTAFGYHLIRVTDTKEENLAQTQKRNRVRQQIAERKAAQIYKEWVEQIIAGAYIVNKLEEE